MNWRNTTKGGMPVRIYSEDGKSPYSIHGAINEGDGWLCKMWSADGKLWCSDICQQKDLVPNTPIIDWSQQPEWCKAVAMDENGIWGRFEHRPRHRNYGVWLRGDNGGFYQPMHPSEYPAFDGDWKDSLCVRPEGGAA